MLKLFFLLCNFLNFILITFFKASFSINFFFWLNKIKGFRILKKTFFQKFINSFLLLVSFIDIFFFQICFFISAISTSDLHSLPVYHLLASRSPVLQTMDAVRLLEQGPCLTSTLTPREPWPALYWRNIIFFVSGKHRVSFSFFKYINLGWRSFTFSKCTLLCNIQCFPWKLFKWFPNFFSFTPKVDPRPHDLNSKRVNKDKSSIIVV